MKPVQTIPTLANPNQEIKQAIDKPAENSLPAAWLRIFIRRKKTAGLPCGFFSSFMA
ncbi:hypothetical protein [Endozoicomonas montiporae]|uniref:hypothetical protein n=1 Tax=Endozoicomonas montiporae TaxID=1027273 RepID=UPI001C9D8FB9|nr:hypothetical protein [Endozoicomonas montiporae]